MSRDGTRVVKNASILMATQLITWALSLLLVVFLPRYLGAAAVGQFAIAGSIWAIMGMLVGFGMDTLLMKEIARNPERTPQLVGTALLLRVILFLLSSVVVAIYVHLMAYPPTTVNIIWIIGLSIFITQLGLACLAALQGLEAMHYSSLAGIISKAWSTGVGISVVLMGYGVYIVGLVNVTSALLSTALLFVFLRRFYKPQFNLQIATTLTMCRASVPYLMSGLGLILYGQVDVLIISSLINTQETGWYGAASQLFGTLLFIPVVFTTAVFPVLTRTYANAPDALPKILRKTFDLMLLVSVPIGLGIFVIAQQGVTLLLGSGFTQSGPILALMGIVLIFTYQNVLIGQFLISTDRQNSWTLIMIVAAVLTIPLDLVLVPWCQREFGNGAMAGALSFIVTELGMVLVGIWLLPKGSLGWSNVWMATRILSAGLVMTAVAWLVRDMFIAIPVIVGAIAYIGMIAILRVVPNEDIALLKEMAQIAPARTRAGWHHRSLTMGILRKQPKAPLGAENALTLRTVDGEPLYTFPGPIISSMRHLETTLMYKGALPARIAMVSALRQEGVTYTTMALATTLAYDLAVRVCVVELNWWSPGVRTEPLPENTTPKSRWRKLFRARKPKVDSSTAHAESEETAIQTIDASGLAAVLMGTATLDEALVQTALPNLMLLPAGNLPLAQRPAMARHDTLKACIKQLSRRFDHILLDVPAILGTSDSIALASLSTACCIVVRQGVTPVSQVRRALDDVKHLSMLGVVLNQARMSLPNWVSAFVPQE